MKYLFTYGLSGVVDAPSEEHARMQLLMGISLSSRVAALGPDIVIRVEKIEEENGAKPDPLPQVPHLTPPHQMEH